MFWLVPTLFLAFGLIFNSQEEERDKEELHNTAEAAFSKNDFAKANEAYLALLDKLDRDTIDWQNYVDIILRTAETHLLLNQYKEGEEMLLILLEEKPPVEFLPRISHLLAKIYSFEEEAGKGYQKMEEVSRIIPIQKWRPEERAFFHTLGNALNAYYENLLQKGKHFTSTNDFQKATIAYEKVHAGIEKGYFLRGACDPVIKKKVAFRLAESRFQLSSLEKREIENDPELLQLATLVDKQRDEFEELLLSSDVTPSFHYESGLFEMGHFYYRNENFNKSKPFFEKLISNQKEITRPIIIGALYLGRIYLKEQNFKNAAHLFTMARKNLKNSDPLLFEVAYLEGMAAFEEKNYVLATQFLEKALTPNKTRGDWAKDALYKLSLSYIHLSKNDGQVELFEKGVNLLEKLLDYEFDEQIFFALLNIHIEKNNVFQIEELNKRFGSKYYLDAELLSDLAKLKTFLSSKIS